MAKRKKPNQEGGSSTSQEKDDIIRQQFAPEVLGLTATLEFPIQVLQTEQYGVWISGIADLAMRARITNNVNKMRRGLFGDWKEISAGVFEMRMDFGPGYRAYYAKSGKVVVILLGGGEKSSQQKDIANAKRLWEELKREITKI